jgi:SAM-dependent methyltransferase
VVSAASRGRQLQYEYYRDTASRYDMQHASVRGEHAFALEHIALYLRWCGAQSVLDSGCGTGRAIRFLRERMPDLELRGNDPSAALLAVATERFAIPDGLLDCASSDGLPYEDDAFDAVIATGVLHHVPNPDRVVDELLRVARKAIFISDSNIYGMGHPLARVAKLVLGRAGLLRGLNWIRRGGRDWYYSEGDGVAYSYSVFDAARALGRACDELIVIPTKGTSGGLGMPLLTSSHLLVCGFKEALP